MDELTPEMQRLLAAKGARRQRLARASFPEKIAALIRLQTIAAPILRRRGRVVAPWRIVSIAPTIVLNEEPPPFGESSQTPP